MGDGSVKTKGRTALVTGSGRNIGAVVAKRLAKQGVNVVVNVRKSVDEGEEVVKEIRREGVDSCLVVADVSKSSEVERLRDEVHSRIGPIDLLVNNVGISPMIPIQDMTDEDWEIVMRTSLYSAFYCIRAFVGDMKAKGFGRIVNVGGHAGLRGTRFKPANAAAKAGLVGLTRSVANEFADAGITCNHVGPGQLVEAHAKKYYRDEVQTIDPEFDERWLSRIPAGRLGTAEEVAAACIFLCSDEASYITGQTLLVNGGMMFV